MDRMERLGLLFEGDENLLQTRTGNYAGNNTHSSSKPSKLGANSSQMDQGSAPVGGNQHPTAQSDSEEGFDEYLKYFAEVHKKNARKQASQSQSKAKAKSGGRRKDTWEENAPEASWSAVASGIETGGVLSPFFCPAIAISRFPYKYVSRELSDPIAKGFFDGGKFWNMSWELYVFGSPLFY